MSDSLQNLSMCPPTISLRLSQHLRQHNGLSGGCRIPEQRRKSVIGVLASRYGSSRYGLLRCLFCCADTSLGISPLPRIGKAVLALPHLLPADFFLLLKQCPRFPVNRFLPAVHVSKQGSETPAGLPAGLPRSGRHAMAAAQAEEEPNPAAFGAAALSFFRRGGH